MSQSQFIQTLYAQNDLLAVEELRVITNKDGVIIEINDVFASMLGMARDDLLGRKLLDNIIFDNYDGLFDGLNALNQSLQQNGRKLNHFQVGDHKVLIGDSMRPVMFHFDWIKNKNGKHYLIGSSFKQDERDQDWPDVLETLEKPSSLPQGKIHAVNHRHDLNDDDVATFSAFHNNVMCVLSRDGMVIRDNGILGQNGYPAIIDNDFINLLHDEDKATFCHYMHMIQDATLGQTISFESRLKTPDHNSDIWMAWQIHTKGDELYCLGHNITDSKLTELSLKRREQELSEAQALANMGHWRWSVGSDILEWSDQIYNIFGVSADEFAPTLDNANARLHKRDIGHMMQAFQRAIIEQNDYDIEFRVVRDDDSIRYIRCEGRCELDGDGDVIALYGVMQDITDQTEHALELYAAKDSAEQAYASKSRFLANMSHELRTPLNAIIGFSDMIENQMLGDIGNEKYLDYAKNIKNSGEHLLELITDILDMSKIEAGKYELDLSTIKLGDIIDSAVRMIESRAQDGVITLDNNAADLNPKIVADRRAVMQIMLNILSNAVKFTEPGGVITVSVDEFDNHVSITVKDTGVGIPANKLSCVLRPFEQASSEFTRNHEGSGLGLAITKELVELHGGTITLDSVENVGTTAHVRLPRRTR